RMDAGGRATPGAVAECHFSFSRFCGGGGLAMPRKGQKVKTRKPSAIKPGFPTRKRHDPIAHNGLVAYMEAHFEWMLVTAYSADTVRARRVAIRRFITWCDERGIDQPQTIAKPILERYQRYLFYYRKPDGA